MSRIDELIAYNKSRVPFYYEEIKRMETMRQTGKGNHLADKTDQDQWIEELEVERRCLRDTISYLEAFKKHGVQP